MDSKVPDLLRTHAKYLQLQGSRVVCSLNGHSLPATVQAIETFVNGKKYAQLRKKATDAAALTKYEPFIVPSKNFSGQLYCSLTCQVMQANLNTVKKHMSGKRFAAAQAEFNDDKRELMEEPDLEESSEAEMDIDTASADVEDDAMTNVDANSLPGNDVQQSMSPASVDKQPPAEAATSSQKRKHASVDTATANIKLPRTRHKSGKAKGRA